MNGVRACFVYPKQSFDNASRSSRSDARDDSLGTVRIIDLANRLVID